jgi:hypothetical protein
LKPRAECIYSPFEARDLFSSRENPRIKAGNTTNPIFKTQSTVCP